MNAREAINRGVNLLGVAVLSIESTLGLFEVFNENEWIDRLDDLMVITLAVIGIAWYLAGGNRYRRSPLSIPRSSPSNCGITPTWQRS